MLRVGIDVGGTNTDAVVMEGRRLLAACKRATSEDIGSGVVAAITEVLRQASVAPSALAAVMIGTTQFTNALVERRRLNRIGVIRVGLPAGASLPPMTAWPEALEQAIGAHTTMVSGGYHFDGRSYRDLDEAAVIAHVRDCQRLGIGAFSVSCVFAPVRDEAERRCAEIILGLMPQAQVTLSSQIGRLGLIERENASLLNAALGEHAQRVVGAFSQALVEMGIAAPLYLSQNDGTLMGAARAQRFPVFTFASGPTNSMRGAAYLTGCRDALVVDIGGTTTDVGALVNGFPRESSLSADIGGVRTNFRMPDVVSIALGGGSRVCLSTDPPQIGPHSVGHDLAKAALVFGGDTLTASDVAVAAGRFALGDPGRVAQLDPARVAQAMQQMQASVETAVDRMKTAAGEANVILVGGGSVLMPVHLAGAVQVLRPEHAGVANAIGAAIAQVGAEVDRTLALAGQDRATVLAGLRAEACAASVAAGADADSTEVVDIEEIPLTYLPGDHVRIRVRAVGELRL